MKFDKMCDILINERFDRPSANNPMNAFEVALLQFLKTASSGRPFKEKVLKISNFTSQPNLRPLWDKVVAAYNQTRPSGGLDDAQVVRAVNNLASTGALKALKVSSPSGAGVETQYQVQ